MLHHAARHIISTFHATRFLFNATNTQPCRLRVVCFVVRFVERFVTRFGEAGSTGLSNTISSLAYYGKKAAAILHGDAIIGRSSTQRVCTRGAIYLCTPEYKTNVYPLALTLRDRKSTAGQRKRCSAWNCWSILATRARTLFPRSSL